MRLIIARCEVHYAGRVTARLPMAVRVVMWKSDGSIMVHSDAGGYKPQNWMTPPTRVTETPEGFTVEKGSGTGIERLQIVIDEVLADSTHDMGDDIRLEKDGVERDLQEALADAPGMLAPGLRLIRREYPTPIGPVDLLCSDGEGYVAVEVKRIGTIDAVEQLTRYLDYIRADRGLEECRGMLVAESIKPQARTLAADREITTLEVELDVVRGAKEPDLRLFDA